MFGLEPETLLADIIFFQNKTSVGGSFLQATLRRTQVVLIRLSNGHVRFITAEEGVCLLVPGLLAWLGDGDVGLVGPKKGVSLFDSVFARVFAKQGIKRCIVFFDSLFFLDQVEDRQVHPHFIVFDACATRNDLFVHASAPLTVTPLRFLHRITI